ncbi:MAG: hypothetical protein ACODAB_02575 [Gemmatimonadota bacterium]
MGWMRTIFLGDIGNRLDIADTEESLSLLGRRMRLSDDRDAEQDAAIRELESEIDELRLLSISLVGILEREGLVNEADLRSLAALEDRGRA